jgi:hypothetical protein
VVPVERVGALLVVRVDFDVERELERANGPTALGAFLSMDEYSLEALVASLELFT